MERSSNSIDTNHRVFAHFDRIGRTPAPARFVADRPLAANALLFMTNIENGDHMSADQPQRRRPLYQGREMGVRWDIGLRLLGMVLIGMAAAAIIGLHSLFQTSGDPTTFLNYLLALLGFIGASFGSALLALGTHIFDEIEVSERWRPRP